MKTAISMVLGQTWLVLSLALVLGGTLALLDQSLRPRIEAHRQRRISQAVLEVVPGGEQSSTIELAGRTAYRVTDANGSLLGWALPTETMGFSDKIQLMVGLSADGTRLTGLTVLESRETPGLGEEIRDAEFRDQFVDQPTDGKLTVVKPGAVADQPIDAITGATISSKAVTEAVNACVLALRDEVRQQATSSPEGPDNE